MHTPVHTHMYPLGGHMHIIHLYCMSWYGRITPITMAATTREVMLHMQQGTMPSM